MVAGQDITKPQITDLTTGEPELGGIYTVSVQVTDDSGVSLVRLYYYFIIAGGITDPVYVVMDDAGADRYQTTLSIPDGASGLNYVFYAYDAFNNAANSDVISRDIIDNEPPIAVSQGNIALDMTEIAVFNGSGSSDNTGIKNYSWTFTYGGSGVTLWGVTQAYEFNIPGIYSVRLTVKDADGNSDFDDFTVTVRDTEQPVANAGIQMYSVVGDIVHFNASASTDNVGVVNYTWSLIHNDTAILLYGMSPSIVLWTPGTYQVTLTVKDGAGNVDTDGIPVHVITVPDEESGYPWWSYVLVGLIVLIVIAAIVIIKI